MVLGILLPFHLISFLQSLGIIDEDRCLQNNCDVPGNIVDDDLWYQVQELMVHYSCVI